MRTSVAHICYTVKPLVYGVPLFSYAVNMAPQNKSELARNIGKILGQRRNDLGMSNRQIALEAGVSHMTVNRAIDADTSVSVDTLTAICRALRLEPWRVLRQAEDAIQTLTPAATIDPATYAKQAEAKLAALHETRLQAAAKHHTPDPYANLGEENQESDK